MIIDSTMRRHLDDFLRQRGAPGHDLVGQIEFGLGPPLLVVASGSVLHGFGNPSSDIDLYVVVDRESITDFPVNSFEGGVHLDINFVRESWLREQAEVLAGTGPEPWLDLPDRAAWKVERRRLNQLNRLVQGLSLLGTDHWRDWQVRAREQFPARALAWWRGEATRYREAARLLAARRPLLAAQRLCDAYLLALNAVCGEAGELYLVDKWVGVKLRRLGRDDLLARFERVLDTPTGPAAAAEYLDLVGQWYDELVGPWRLPEPRLRLSPADGVTEWRSAGSVLLHRHALRGVELPAGTPDPLPWTGKADEVTDTHRTLIEEGLAWLSIA